MEVVTESKPKRKFDWYSLIAALMLVILGVTILIWPGEAGTILVYVLGGLIAAVGLVRTILYFVHAEHPSPFSFGGLTVGLTLLAVGVLVLLKPELITKLLPALLGFLLIFSGFGSMQTAIELARLKVRKWWIPLLFAVASIVCGVLAIANPFSAIEALMVFLGIALLIEGLLLIVSLCLFGKAVK